MAVNNHHVFMILILCIGIVLGGLSWNIDITSINNNCNDKDFLILNKSLYTLSLLMVGVSFSFFVCSLHCDSKGFDSVMIYAIIMFILGIGLIVLGSLMLQAIGKCKTLNSSMEVIISLGSLIVLLCIIYFIYNRKGVSSNSAPAPVFAGAPFGQNK